MTEREYGLSTEKITGHQRLLSHENIEMSRKDKQKESWSNRCNESGRLTGGFSKYNFLELERLIGSFKIRKMTSMWYFY